MSLFHLIHAVKCFLAIAVRGRGGGGVGGQTGYYHQPNEGVRKIMEPTQRRGFHAAQCVWWVAAGPRGRMVREMAGNMARTRSACGYRIAVTIMLPICII
jgi:hypothetical protein